MIIYLSNNNVFKIFKPNECVYIDFLETIIETYEWFCVRACACERGGKLLLTKKAKNGRRLFYIDYRMNDYGNNSISIDMYWISSFVTYRSWSKETPRSLSTLQCFMQTVCYMCVSMRLNACSTYHKQITTAMGRHIVHPSNV